MLAIKGKLAREDRIPVLIFDEIDANIGGRMGKVVGRKLRSLAAHHQVLCVTHLPQIACFAHRHLKVIKKVHQEKTKITVKVLEGEERVQEIAEMIRGKGWSQTTLKQAKEMLAEAGREKEGGKG
jgi:DNA repair protein RecN (Recombination protein N)